MKRYWWLSILPVALLLWWGLDRGDSAPEIHFSAVHRTTIESTVLTNGKIEPEQWAAARAETAGIVQGIAVQRGQAVAAGQALVRLNTTGAQAELARALAREQEARVEVATVRQGGKISQVADLNNRIASAQEAVAVAQRNYEADQRLLERQAATKLQVQNDKDTLDKAKLLVRQLEDQKRTLVTASDQEVAQAKLHDAQAAVASATHQLALCEVKSPLSGTVYQFDLKVGAYLQPGELVGLVGNIDQVKVIVYVDEPDLGRVGLGMPVKIKWDARPGQVWWGKVDKLPTEVVALGTRTVGEVSTVIDNPDHDLLPGVSVNVTIVSRVVKDAPSIPKAALRTISGKDGVYKLERDSIVWTPVTTGVSDINNVQILSGLTEGDHVADRVVEPPDAEIKNHMRVKPDFN
ncbi:MAG: efflux RND transporter periplasmic adaptor subunit [Acidobacteriaceae bacterium]|nr:efflux RND transporter periplasmic adaptor subunit [Acidobacteriaceae bacterium]